MGKRRRPNLHHGADLRARQATNARFALRRASQVCGFILPIIVLSSRTRLFVCFLGFLGFVFRVVLPSDPQGSATTTPTSGSAASGARRLQVPAVITDILRVNFTLNDFSALPFPSAGCSLLLHRVARVRACAGPGTPQGGGPGEPSG